MGLLISCKDSVDVSPDKIVSSKDAPKARKGNQFEISGNNENNSWAEPSGGVIISNPFDNIFFTYDGNTRGSGPGALGPNAPLVQAQIDAVNIAKANLTEFGVTDFEEAVDVPKTIHVPITNQCQFQALRDYYGDCATIEAQYEEQKGDCLRSVGYNGAALTILTGNLSWKNFTQWFKGNRLSSLRTFMTTLSIANIAAIECVESKLSSANDKVKDANREFALRYGRCP